MDTFILLVGAACACNCIPISCKRLPFCPLIFILETIVSCAITTGTCRWDSVYPDISPFANTAPPEHEPSRSRSEEHTSELQSRENLVCRLLLEKKKQ